MQISLFLQKLISKAELSHNGSWREMAMTVDPPLPHRRGAQQSGLGPRPST